MKKDSDEKLYFTVRELIERLKAFPSDLPVLVSGYESGYDNFYEPFVGHIVHAPENMYFDGEYQNPDNNGEEVVEAVLLVRVMRDD